MIQTAFRSAAIRAGYRPTVVVETTRLVLGSIADTAWAIIRRRRAGLSIAHADSRHIHHHLLDFGLSQRQTCLVFYGATAAQFMAEVKRLIENPVTLVVPPGRSARLDQHRIFHLEVEEV